MKIFGFNIGREQPIQKIKLVKKVVRKGGHKYTMKDSVGVEGVVPLFDVRTSTGQVSPRIPYQRIFDVAIRVPRVMSCVNVIVRDSTRAGVGLVAPPMQDPVESEIMAWRDFIEYQAPNGDVFDDVIQATFSDLELYDIFMWETVKNGLGKVLYIKRIDPRTVTKVKADPSGSGKWVEITQNVNGKEKVISASNIIHGSKYQKCNVLGLPPIIHIWDDLGLYLFAIAASGDSFEFSRTPKGLLTLPPVSDKFWAEFETERKAVQQGKSQNRILTLRGVENTGVTEFVKFSEDNISLQYIEQIKLIDNDINTTFGVPDIKLGLASAGKLANPEMQLVTYYDVIGSGHSTVSRKINSSILPLLGIKTMRTEFNRPEEEDMFRMITMGKMATESGLMTINEWRIRAGMPPVSWGDQPRVSVPTPNLPRGVPSPEDEQNNDEELANA